MLTYQPQWYFSLDKQLSFPSLLPHAGPRHVAQVATIAALSSRQQRSHSR